MESSTSSDGMHQNAALVLRLDLSGGLTESTADARVDCTTNVRSCSAGIEGISNQWVLVSSVVKRIKNVKAADAVYFE